MRECSAQGMALNCHDADKALGTAYMQGSGQACRRGMQAPASHGGGRQDRQVWRMRMLTELLVTIGSQQEAGLFRGVLSDLEV